MENITVTQLFNLLNERQNADLHTILSTNLNMTELKGRYTERITSRLLDNRRCKILKFIGADIRTRLERRRGRTVNVQIYVNRENPTSSRPSGS